MMRARFVSLLVLLALAAVVSTACGATARLSVVEGTGPHPVLPPPDDAPVPTVHVVTARRWPAHATPDVARDMEITALARDLDHPRWLYVLPNGDVLVAETNAPDRPDDNTGLKGWLFKRFQKQAGGGVPSANRLTLLRDADGDGLAEIRTTFASGLNSPFGMALVGDTLYVANTDGIVPLPVSRWRHGCGRRAGQGGRTFQRARATITGQRTSSRRLTAPRLYASVGSNSNVAEHGMEEEDGRAAIWEVNLKTGACKSLRQRSPKPVGHGLVRWPALGLRERARRAGQRPGARLHDRCRGRRVLWLALQLLRTASGFAREAAASRPGGEGAGSRLRARTAYGVTGSGRVAPRHDQRGVDALPERFRTGCSWVSTARGTASLAAAIA